MVLFQHPGTTALAHKVAYLGACSCDPDDLGLVVGHI